ncbi:MAG: hypothetical protein ABIR47_03625 [Candidatus Kapaibacterium sp.]
MSEESKELEFHFVKTPSYRSYAVDGAFGGITSKGKVYMELFLERAVTPTSIVYDVSNIEDFKEIRRNGKQGYIREVECGIILDIQGAIAVHNWLGTRIKEYIERFNSATETES